MSEHDDPAISALYRRVSDEEPAAHLDDRVMKMARSHIARRSHRWWLPLSTAAVMVLAISLLLRHQQMPGLQTEMARPQAGQAASEPMPPPSPEAVQPSAPESPRKQIRAAEKPAPMAQSIVTETEAKAPPAEAERRAESPSGPAAAGALASKSTDDLVGAMEDSAAASSPLPRAKAEEQQKRKVETEAAEPWLKRIEALRAKGEIEVARRELAAFRKAYPAWPLPKELQALLPEATK